MLTPEEFADRIVMFEDQGEDGGSFPYLVRVFGTMTRSFAYRERAEKEVASLRYDFARAIREYQGHQKG